jgi:hypothetical protein
VLAKQALSFAPPFAFAAERSVGGALALLLVLKLMGRPLRLSTPGPTLAIGLAQITGFTVTNIRINTPRICNMQLLVLNFRWCSQPYKLPLT